jgi:hypothetical protein
MLSLEDRLSGPVRYLRRDLAQAQADHEACQDPDQQLLLMDKIVAIKQRIRDLHVDPDTFQELMPSPDLTQVVS